MRISDWSSDVCSSDLFPEEVIVALLAWSLRYVTVFADDILAARCELDRLEARRDRLSAADSGLPNADRRQRRRTRLKAYFGRSEEHTSELQSLMRISYAFFCLIKKIITSINKIIHSQMNILN